MCGSLCAGDECASFIISVERIELLSRSFFVFTFFELIFLARESGRSCCAMFCRELNTVDCKINDTLDFYCLIFCERVRRVHKYSQELLYAGLVDTSLFLKIFSRM